MRDVLELRYARHCTAEGHRPLFDFISDVYFGKVDKAILRASRGAGKTLGYAALYVLETVFKDAFGIVHIGGTEQQAKAGYAYYAGKAEQGRLGFICKPAFKELLAAEPMQSKTVLQNGSWVEIATGGSAKSVSSKHPILLGVDEADHIDLPVMDIAVQMPQSQGVYAAQTIIGSSQYESFGTLQAYIDQADERGFSVYELDLLDVMEPCGRLYPGQCKECGFYMWNNPYTGEREELCCGRGAKSSGHYAYRDALNKLANTLSVESFALQYFLIRGVSQGLVYSTFDGDIGGRHVKSFPPSGADLSQWKAFGGIDIRTKGRIEIIAEAPQAVGNRKLRWVIAEWTDNDSTPSKIHAAAFELRARILALYGLTIDVFWMESSASDEATDWQKLGLNGRIIPKEVRSVQYRIGQVRDALLDANGATSLFVDPTCTDLIRSMSKLYHCKRSADGMGYDRDKPDESGGGAHACDALGYAYIGGPMGSASTHLPDVTTEETRAGWWDFGNKWLVR